tara:strand:- start:1306 stop:2019 length:714 start_codon:yes stop_codon:yes gene_type:complete
LSEILARVEQKNLTLQKARDLNGGKTLNKENMPALITNWVNNTVLLKKAKELDLHKDSLIIKKRDVFFNELIISSFMKQGFNPNIVVSKKEVLDYYKDNKGAFVRKNDQVFLEHYFTEKINFSKKLKSFFIFNKKPDINIADFLIEAKTVTRGRMSSFFEPYVFDTNEKTIGPIRSKKGYHFFKILNRYKKNSVVGLDFVYDEIYQRIYIQKEKKLSLLYLDSIKNSLEIYINPKYQ